MFWIAYKFYANLMLSQMLERFILTATIAFFYFQSPIIKSVSELLDCTLIDNEKHISAYLFEQCSNNPRYLIWRNAMAIPAFIFFTIILPSIPFYYMQKNKDIIFNGHVLRKIGFLLNGYTDKTFYW